MVTQRGLRLVGVAVVAMALSAGIGWIASGRLDRPRGPRPSIFVVLIDTLRADHLSLHGYGRDTCPRLADIARHGVVFDRCFSPSPWTNPTIAALFTGRYPQSILPPAPHAVAIRQRLPDGVTTLAEALQRSGYHTASFVDHPGISPAVNYDQGFDDYGFLRAGWHDWAGARPEDVLAGVSQQLDAIGGDPFFYYLHLVYPHFPYAPPAELAGRYGEGYQHVREAERQGLLNRYDEEIRFTDQLVGAVFDELQRRGLAASTYFVVLSDHGEGFWEHGLWEHGNTLFDELLRVPLIVHPPGGGATGPTRIDALTSVLDLYPTFLELAGVRPPTGLDGHSLLGDLSGAGVRSGPAAAGAAVRQRRALFSESPHSLVTYGIACRVGDFKLVYTPSSPVADGTSLLADLRAGRHTALYDLVRDPGETRDVRGDHAAIADGLAVRTALHWQRQSERRAGFAYDEAELSEDSIARLKALGYLRSP